MRTSLIEIAVHYSRIFLNLSNSLFSINDSTTDDKIHASHYIHQVKHHAENAILEIENLPNEKETS